MVLLPLVTSLPTRDKKEADPDHFVPPPPPSYGHPKPAPSYGHPPGSYEKPKYNCSVYDVTEYGEVCLPVIQTDCNPVEIQFKRIKDIDFTYTGMNKIVDFILKFNKFSYQKQKGFK